MARRASPYRKLLEQWQPPKDAGSPVGCLTTTFTFSAPFFEEQCLSRFLNIESDPDTDGPLYLIEREEKMADLSGAVVLADSLHCNEARNLRWDIIPARVVGGVQHAKVSLLVWQHCVRIIVASANMTEDGYCKNQEVYGVLDYSAASNPSRRAAESTLEFLSKLPALVAANSESKAVQRWQAVIEQARGSLARWSQVEDTLPAVDVYPLFVTPGEPNLFDASYDSWAYGGWSEAHVVSPFFDPEDRASAATANALLKILTARGTDKTVHWYATGEESPEGGWWLHLPKACDEVPQRKGIKTVFNRVELNLKEEEAEHFRPLHAKLFWLASRDRCAYVLGSSNFTQRGLGLSVHPNIEANLVYVFRRNNGKVYKAFNNAWPAYSRVRARDLLFGDVRHDDDEPESQSQSALPLWCVDASLDSIDGAIQLVLTLDKPTGDWVIRDHEDNEVVASSAQWKEKGRPGIFSIPWERPVLPRLLKVDWDERFAFWPVNIADMSLLPPPEELRDLSLDTLLDILTSQGSLREAMRRILKRRQGSNGDDAALADALDPHKRVQTSHHLIPRTRRISRVFAGLQNRLERPVVTLEALNRRLYGPVGVMAVVHALDKHAQSNDELAFLLSELMLVLKRIDYTEQEGVLSEKQFNAGMQQVLSELSERLAQASAAASPMIGAYSNKVCRECLPGGCG